MKTARLVIRKPKEMYIGPAIAALSDNKVGLYVFMFIESKQRPFRMFNQVPKRLRNILNGYTYR